MNIFFTIAKNLSLTILFVLFSIGKVFSAGQIGVKSLDEIQIRLAELQEKGADIFNIYDSYYRVNKEKYNVPMSSIAVSRVQKETKLYFSEIVSFQRELDSLLSLSSNAECSKKVARLETQFIEKLRVDSMDGNIVRYAMLNKHAFGYMSIASAYGNVLFKQNCF